MKATFKPLSLAVAVAAAGVAGTSNAQTQMDLAAETGLGDLALVPYYTVREDWTTGVSVINSSEKTQVIKIRMRRAVDSMDALDFNVVLSPNDVWTGYAARAEELDASGERAIRWYSNDNSCTVPALTEADTPYLEMPTIYRAGAETGYIEILTMGETIDEAQPIARDALHAEAFGGLPANCPRVVENFLRGTTPVDYAADYASLPSTIAGTPRFTGVINSELTMNATAAAPGYETSAFEESENVIRVSYFIRDGASGTEFGNAATHIANFFNGASMTNQVQGVAAGDLQGFDSPDLNGAAPFSDNLGIGGDYGTFVFDQFRFIMGASQIVNDWSANDTGNFSVNTDWVVTAPGQYLMLDLPQYLASLASESVNCLPGTPGDPNVVTATGANCDFRDLPLTVAATVYSREEDEIGVTPDEVVVSPAPIIPPEIVTFDREVNVVVWGVGDDGEPEAVINEDEAKAFPRPEGALAGWANVTITPDASKTRAICQFDQASPSIVVSCAPVSTGVPLIGFVAWERNFDSDPSANFGRIVEHAFPDRGVVGP
jgi:hypothetical protein